AFGPVGANAPDPTAGAAFARGNRAREEIAPQVLLKAQQGKGLWECAPAVLTKGCYGGIGVEASFPTGCAMRYPYFRRTAGTMNGKDPLCQESKTGKEEAR